MNTSKQYVEMNNFINHLQNLICSKLEESEVIKFREDTWLHNEGGGGKTRVLENGLIIEKGAVNTSSIMGRLTEQSAKQISSEIQDFAVCGISVIIHPESPKIPTIHMNVRYFELENGRSWFGGGIDLTPYYPLTDDFQLFHQVLKNACEGVIPDSYTKLKTECDKYFTIQHRNEMRGIGGIFFDYIDGKNPVHFDLVKSVGNSFLDAYLPIIKMRFTESYSDDDKKFQLLRRGRYVEFNLIYDRGTLFGLKTNGRVESILVSLPPKINFYYNREPKPGSPQEEMLKYYQPVDWV